MTKEELLAEFVKLSDDDQVILAFNIEKYMTRPVEPTPLTAAQMTELKRRVEYYDKHPDEWISLEDAKTKIDRRMAEWSAKRKS